MTTSTSAREATIVQVLRLDQGTTFIQRLIDATDSKSALPASAVASEIRYSAALMISSATSFGKDSIATWLDGTSIAVALAAFT